MLSVFQRTNAIYHHHLRLMVLAVGMYLSRGKRCVTLLKRPTSIEFCRIPTPNDRTRQFYLSPIFFLSFLHAFYYGQSIKNSLFSTLNGIMYDILLRKGQKNYVKNIENTARNPFLVGLILNLLNTCLVSQNQYR